MSEGTGLSRDALKLAAMISMVLDHAALALVPAGTAAYAALRFAGRLSYPVFMMLFADGCWRSQMPAHLRMLKLCLVAMISEPFYDFAVFGTIFYPGMQNAMWSWVLAVPWFRWIAYSWDEVAAGRMDRFSRSVLSAVFAVILIFVCGFFHVDYGTLHGACAVVCGIVIADGPIAGRTKVCGVASAVATAVSMRMPGALLAVPASLAYVPSKEGRFRVPKAVGYLFYPVHLALLSAVRSLVGR